MSIEVRQLVIRCQVVMPAHAQAHAPSAPASELLALKEQLIAECRVWLRDELQRAKER